MPTEQARDRLERLAASVLVVGFDGTTLEDTLRELLQTGVAGVILFKRNVQDPVQVADLLSAIQAARPEPLPLFACVDQEGGRVARLRAPLTEWPELAWVGRTGDEGLARRFGQALTRELKAVGFNVNFAPVMDVNSNPTNPVIGARSLSHDPDEVARLGVAVLSAIQEEGMLACAKHFPGHGDTRSDSHFELPELPHSLERLHTLELVPFKAAIAAGVSLIMTAHVRFLALDPEVPATLSHTVLTGLLRQTLGFQGVIVTDDLEMKAVVEPFGITRSVQQGLLAGVDCFLICHLASRVQEAIQALADLAERSPEALARLEESSARLRMLRERLPLPERLDPQTLLARVGLPEHQALSAELRRRGAPAPVGGVAPAPQDPPPPAAAPPVQEPKPSTHFLDI